MQKSLGINATDEIKEYYNEITKLTQKQIEIAKKAKEKGYDLSTDIETQPAKDLAERAEAIIGPKGVAKRYRELFKEMKGRRINAIFKLFKEMIEQKWCFIPDESKRIEHAIKTALVLNTEGVVVAPIDGVPKVKISENPDGSKYIDIYYAGPIRAAGGTSQVLPLILGDYARKLLDLDRYKPTQDEIERYVEETQIYEEIVSRQYRLKPDEVRKIIKGCPVCINGEPTEEREVSVHRDLKRIPHNRIRGGMCLVISEGVALKAQKILKYARMLNLEWDWLEEIIKVGKGGEEKIKIKPKAAYLEGTAAGRPIFSYPSRFGGFRLRYGRSRGTGIMGKAVHPATMYLLDEFIAIGTQIKVERPGKAGGITSCDSIEGPIVKLDDGSVKKLRSAAEAIELRDRVEKILFLGDLLVPFGDFKQSAHPLIPAGYCEEWWKKELEKVSNKEKFQKAIKNPTEVNAREAFKISEELGIPLHPKFTHYYCILDESEVEYLVREIKKANVVGKETPIKALIENTPKTKELLEKIGLEHYIENGKIAIGEEQAYAFLRTFGYFSKEKIKAEKKGVLAILSSLAGVPLRDKCGSFIGSRMGRPEQSKPREMKGNPHSLFPVANYGGSMRSINKAMVESEQKKGIEIEIGLFKCPKCKKTTPFPYCNNCKTRTIKINICENCSLETTEEKCPKCNTTTRGYTKRKERIETIINNAAKNLGISVPELVKGVRGMINAEKITEPIEKGLLRAKYNVHLFRDGTIRYELINNPLTHFKPAEIGTSIEKLRELGYTKDIEGKELKSEEQILELKPQDIIIHDDAGEFFLKVSHFIDEELERFYGLKAHYNASRKEDLIGELVLGLAPHTSAAIVGRIIGYCSGRGCFAHPFFHQTKRRNCDGDQDSLMLLLDGLLNFSQHYLPSSRGGRMDAPLVFTVVLRPTEIDDEVYSMEVCTEYPLELYEKALEFSSPEEVEGIEIVENRLGGKGQYSGFGFTHNTTSFCDGPLFSRYVQLHSMEDKIGRQAKLQSKIMAVDTKDSIERVMVSHFMPDIIGNARAFSRQKFRCTTCNAKYRRLPLNGKCDKCGNSTLILTIAQGSVRKYLEIAKNITKEYNLSDYLKQRIDLIEEEIDSIFGNDKAKQKSLGEFA